MGINIHIVNRKEIINHSSIKVKISETVKEKIKR